ncbi:MAG: V-type ATP synthase subunit C [Halobacteriaceae archaeon]
MSAEASNFEYVTARVRNRRAMLFDEEEYNNLLRMGTGEISRFMQETEYDREIDALASRHSGVDLIEYALNQNLSRHFDDLLRWSEGKLYDQVARYLRKFDAWNIKTALRGVYTNADATEISDDFIAAGEFSETRLERLQAASEIEEIIDILDDTIFSDGLEAAYEDYEESGLLVPLENAVDRAYYENLIDQTSPGSQDRATELYVEFLQAEIDFRNVRNSFRIARSGADIDPAEYYIEGGQLFTRAELRQLISNIDEMISFLRDSQYGDELSEALEEVDDTESLMGFEHALESALLKYSDHLSHVYPLSVCPVLAFILAKEREVNNIRAIARGREAGLSREEIEEELVQL